MKNVIDWLEKSERGLLSTLIASSIVMSVVGVFYRYVLNQSIAYVEEIAGLIMAAVIGMGSSLAITAKEHIRVHSELEHVEFIPLNDINAFNLENPLAGLSQNEAPVVDRSCVCNMCKIEDKWEIYVATPCATVALAIDLHVTRPVGTANDQFCSALGRKVNR